MRVLCCTMYSPSHKPLAEVSLPNLGEYCARHKYNIAAIPIEDDKWEYKKHEWLEQMFEKGGWDIIWYKDIDSVITNMNKRIEDFVNKKHDFFITRDFTELNGGSIIIKNSDGGRWVNDFILDKRNEYENEQNIINAFSESVDFSAHMKILPHPSINSYNYSLYPECKEYVGKDDFGDWRIGNFVLHVPGLGFNDRIEVLKNAKITT